MKVKKTFLGILIIGVTFHHHVVVGNIVTSRPAAAFIPVTSITTLDRVVSTTISTPEDNHGDILNGTEDGEGGMKMTVRTYPSNSKITKRHPCYC